MRARLFLLAGALLAFGASLGSGFHFDDYGIFSDPILSSTRGWLEMWGLRQTRPLTFLTFWLNRQIGGGDPLGYHLFNLTMHLGAVLLAWECFQRLLPRRAAYIAAFLFAIHPIQSEPVDYVWARSIVLAGLLCLASLWNWLEGRRWTAVAWFLLALLAKEEVAAFPLFIAWLEWRRGDGEGPRPWAPVGAMLGLSLAAGARAIYATAAVHGSLAGPQAGISPGHYLLAQGAAILRYLQLVVLPYGFTVEPQITTSVWFAIVAWLAIVAILVLAFRRAPAVATWLAGGLLLLLPSSSIFPAADLAADRRMYLPMFAFAAALALLLDRIKPVAPLAVIGGALLGLSSQRTLVWMNDERLWREAVERAPARVRPKFQLARALPASQALELLNRARTSAPHDPTIAAEMGRILLTEGQPDAALEEFGRALALEPMNPQFINNRGVALQALGQTEAARGDFLRALQFDPAFAEAKENLAKLPPE